MISKPNILSEIETTSFTVYALKGICIFPNFAKNAAGNLFVQKRVPIFVLKSNGKVMKTANFTELRNSLKSYLDGVTNDSEPLLVHRSGHASVVILSLDEYNSMKETEYIMKSPTMMDVIRKGKKEIAAGQGNVVNIDELWK